MRVLCVLTDGFEELEAVGTIALLRRANIEIDIYDLNRKEATGRFGITIKDIETIDDVNLEAYDALFIPGGPHYKKLLASNKVIEIIKYFFENDKVVSAICAAPTILGKLGYLKGKEYTCFTSMNEDFGGTYKDQYYVVDGNLVTGRSAAAVIDFAFGLIEKLKGKEQAEATKNEIYYY